LITIGILLIINTIGSQFFYRFDLTKDIDILDIVKQVKEPLYIKIYLQGDLPAEFIRLQRETQQLLEEFQAYNQNIVLNSSIHWKTKIPVWITSKSCTEKD
jgi:hypothetical protein